MSRPAAAWSMIWSSGPLRRGRMTPPSRSALFEKQPVRSKNSRSWGSFVPRTCLLFYCLNLGSHWNSHNIPETIASRPPTRTILRSVIIKTHLLFQSKSFASPLRTCWGAIPYALKFTISPVELQEKMFVKWNKIHNTVQEQNFSLILSVLTIIIGLIAQ